MKVKKLIKKLYAAIAQHDIAKENRIYHKLTKKSLKGKKTHAVQ